MHKNMSKLSIRLRELREEKKLLQKDIANLLNITASAYGYYEQGKREPDTHTVKSLADFYNVSTDYLLGRTNNRRTEVQISCIENSLIAAIDSLSPQSKKELEKYVQLLKLKDLMENSNS